MKRTISTLAILTTLAAALPAKAGEIPSRADMMKALIVVGTYARICATPLSEAAKARTLTVLRLLGPVDSDLLEIAVTAYSDGIARQDVGLASQDTGAWCRETGEALAEGSK